jgi:hypothetical protein
MVMVRIRPRRCFGGGSARGKLTQSCLLKASLMVELGLPDILSTRRDPSATLHSHAAKWVFSNQTSSLTIIGKFLTNVRIVHTLRVIPSQPTSPLPYFETLWIRSSGCTPNSSATFDGGDGGSELLLR